MVDEKTTETSTRNALRGCLGLVAITVFCMVGAAALVYGLQWLVGW